MFSSNARDVSSVSGSASTRVALAWRMVGLDILENSILTDFNSISPLLPICYVPASKDRKRVQRVAHGSFSLDAYA
jgi:hypothetical protein